MFQSPLKTVSEKIKPVESKSSVSSLKFERPSDFKKFINFIKNETKELEKIKLPKMSEVKPAGKRKGVFGLLGLGLLGLLGSGFGDDDGDGKDRFSIAGGTKSQFEKLIPGVPVGGLKNLRQTKAGTLNLQQSLRERRLGKFREKTKGEKIAEKKLKSTRKRIPKKQRKFTKASDAMRELMREQRRITKKTNMVQVKSTLKFFEKQGLPMTQGEDPFVYDATAAALDDFMKMDLSKMDANKKAFYTDKFLKAFSDESLAKQFGEYSAKDFEDAKKLSKQLQEDLNKEVELEEKLKDKLKEERKKRFKKRYAFRGDPKLKINFDLFGKNVKFTPKDFLSGKFKQFGTATKPARDMFTKTMSKIPGSKATFGAGKSLLKGLGKRYDIITTLFEGYQLVKGFVVGDNILTAYYDLGVAIHNMFQPDKAKLMTYITNHQDSRLKVKKQQKNQKILQEIQKAKEAQALSGGFNPINKASDIVPFAVQKTGQQIMLSSPAFTGYRFILDKLYKQ